MSKNMKKLLLATFLLCCASISWKSSAAETLSEKRKTIYRNLMNHGKNLNDQIKKLVIDQKNAVLATQINIAVDNIEQTFTNYANALDSCAENSTPKEFFWAGEWNKTTLIIYGYLGMLHGKLLKDQKNNKDSSKTIAKTACSCKKTIKQEIEKLKAEQQN